MSGAKIVGAVRAVASPAAPTPDEVLLTRAFGPPPEHTTPRPAPAPGPALPPAAATSPLAWFAARAMLSALTRAADHLRGRNSP